MPKVYYIDFFLSFFFFFFCQRIKFNKNKNAKKGASGIAEFTGSYVDASADASYLMNPSIVSPFVVACALTYPYDFTKALPLGLPPNTTLTP